MEGKNVDTFGAFFDELGPERCQKIKVVTMDMSKAYISAAEKRVPRARSGGESFSMVDRSMQFVRALTTVKLFDPPAENSDAEMADMADMVAELTAVAKEVLDPNSSDND